jgi:hypothetical protein
VLEFSRLKGSDPVTGVEMSSTEKLLFGDDFNEAFLKACLQLKRVPKGVLLSM